MTKTLPGAREDGASASQSRRGGRVALQLAGFAASSHWLLLAVSALPGFEESRLAQVGDGLLLGGPGEVARALVVFALLPAVLEELVFRGLFFALLERIGGLLIAIFGSAALFGLAHLDLHHALVASALGLQLGALRHAHGLRMAIAAHLTNNTLALGGLALTRSGSAEALGSGAGPLTLVSLGVALLLSGSACASLTQTLRRSLRRESGASSDLQTSARQDE